jgi:hypothetical protein
MAVIVVSLGRVGPVWRSARRLRVARVWGGKLTMPPCTDRLADILPKSSPPQQTNAMPSKKKKQPNPTRRKFLAPQLLDEIQKVKDSIDAESDLACALNGGALIEKALKTLMTAMFRDTSDSDSGGAEKPCSADAEWFGLMA